MHLLLGRQDVDLTGADKDTIAIVAFKVALPLDRAIVLAILFIELDANPDTWCKGSLADEEDFAMTEVGNLYARV